MRASDLLGTDAYDVDGRYLGRIADLLTEPGPDGTPVVRAALVAPRRRVRLLGYERDELRRPWLIDRIARWLHRDVREIPWTSVRLAKLPGTD
ncbi:PRC-barrel domain-containing protein [Amycolatopsis pretoriensis]|uniref:PRC-barrel domain-containing protein n=1 Tax=Amycolatopsis pretoriensis TaxID=218821 RepID=A0A1H5RI48_9PSEU|nr:PRC-barrel domain-containing protein [Amycolatopsis pretoriensis]SEF37171.1 PRC-barrel domain-containing protein [Amycolatopsis pretoriensis]